ncbi:hypothetical protein L1077_12055 [Pseudoalteromonas luteoviolacea]|uniref:hypothetical protein n=1 Tax=Pseudoalteromonas luteoviolacea TaxID=43657 RepID=UPI001F2A668A|nr:hypothetical protein [Pseudoalteromonas luteoviolacea]MCF6440169.1 hypothetical protein [Pseudoalteromonas luteoviolacea]
MKRIAVLMGLSVFFTTGCDVFENSKAQIEAQYLSENHELQAVIEQIREQGLEAMAQSAQAGTMASCVASKLDGDPMGALVEVEGALQDGASVAELANSIASLTEQEISLESIPELLKAGAETVTYLRTLLETYDLAELQTQFATILEQGQTKTEDIGTHLRGLIEQCN